MAQRGVAIELARKWPPRQNAREEPHRGSRIATINALARRTQSVPAFAVNAERFAVTEYFNAHLFKCTHGTRIVLAAGKIEHSSAARGNAPEDHCSVGDRFVARNGDLTADRFFDRFDSLHRFSARNALTNRVSAREFFFQLRAFTVANPAIEPDQISDVIRQRAPECSAIHQAHIAPQLRATRCNPSEIFKAARTVFFQ